jgi:hypothetical protein
VRNRQCSKQSNENGFSFEEREVSRRHEGGILKQEKAN